MGLAMPAALADPTHFGVGSWIERRARIAPDTVALIHDDRSFTYGELAGRVRRLANGLHRLGVARGDRVAWLGANHPSFLEALFASGLLGAALAPVNHRLEPGENPLDPSGRGADRPLPLGRAPRVPRRRRTGADDASVDRRRRRGAGRLDGGRRGRGRPRRAGGRISNDGAGRAGVRSAAPRPPPGSCLRDVRGSPSTELGREADPRQLRAAATSPAGPPTV